MAFERVVCEVYFVINVSEIYSERRSVDDYRGIEFAYKIDAERFLAEEGYTCEDGGARWKKSQSYCNAWISRHLREVKE